jgi:hypothetical protein
MRHGPGSDGDSALSGVEQILGVEIKKKNDRSF